MILFPLNDLKKVRKVNLYRYHQKLWWIIISTCIKFVPPGFVRCEPHDVWWHPMVAISEANQVMISWNMLMMISRLAWRSSEDYQYNLHFLDSWTC